MNGNGQKGLYQIIMKFWSICQVFSKQVGENKLKMLEITVKKTRKK